MSYFTSLARQTGIGLRPAAPAAAPVRSLEVEEARLAPAPVASAVPPGMAKQRQIDVPAPVAARVFSVTMGKLAEASPTAAAEPAARIAPALNVAPPPPASVIEVPAPAGPARPRPTLADVRAWVSRPARETVELPALEPQSAPSPAAPVFAGKEAADSYNLEIGTIQIVVEAPPVAAVQPPAPRSRAPEPTRPSWGRASRHYLRP